MPIFAIVNKNSLEILFLLEAEDTNHAKQELIKKFDRSPIKFQYVFKEYMEDNIEAHIDRIVTIQGPLCFI